MQLLSVFNFAIAIQGIFLAYLVANKRFNSLSYRILALLLLSMSLTILGSVLGLSGYYRQFPHLIRVADPLVFLFGPLLYFYIQLQTTEKLTKYYYHLIPFVLYVLVTIPFYLLSGEEKIRFGEDMFLKQQKPVLVAAIQSARMVHISIYIIMSLISIKRYHRLLGANFSNIEKYDLEKVRRLLRLFLILLVIALVISAVSLTGKINLIVANNLISLGMGVVIYGLAYSVWNKPDINSVQGLYVPETDTSGGAAESKEAKSRSTYHLSETQYLRFSDQLKVLMEETKPYLKSEFSLNDLSAQLNLQPYLTSELLSRYYKASFFDVINSYRVNEVKERLSDPSFRHYSILSIAYDCGFNSKSSFNTAFKKFARKTPSEYRDTQPA
jgi:AraC-like DNA-binding protein